MAYGDILRGWVSEDEFVRERQPLSKLKSNNPINTAQFLANSAS